MSWSDKVIENRRKDVTASDARYIANKYNTQKTLINISNDINRRILECAQSGEYTMTSRYRNDHKKIIDEVITNLTMKEFSCMIVQINNFEFDLVVSWGEV